MSINKRLNQLIQFGLNQKLFGPLDVDYVGNRLIDVLGLPELSLEGLKVDLKSPTPILEGILDDAFKRGEFEVDTVLLRDLLDAKVMDCLMPRPSEVVGEFQKRYKESPKAATDYFYRLSQVSNYIRTERVAKDKRWQVETPYGILDMTINLSKPEKDPKAISLAKATPSTQYPKCLLCKENVGYAGHLNHPSRNNHRIVPVTLSGEPWYLQYSPYVYYNEHCIVLKEDHSPMTISKATFQRLLAFVSQFKHYFVGSNADLPIVGGSILSHDHFQGGSYEFAMEKAGPLRTYKIDGFENVEVDFLQWPLSVLRLKGSNEGDLVRLGDRILRAWRTYSDEALGLRAFSNGEPHHTITPIARFKDGKFELDLVLRDNQTSELHPFGNFHPHEHLHHLKKENIGLIEVMGLAVLPGRLKEEMEVVQNVLETGDSKLLIEQGLEKHSPWAEELLQKHGVVSGTMASLVIEQELGLKFVEILECCGVYKLDEEGLAGIERFINYLSTFQ